MAVLRLRSVELRRNGIWFVVRCAVLKPEALAKADALKVAR